MPVWLLGLDTAWLAGADADAGRLRLTKDQVLMLGTDAQGRRLPGLRVALGHHPLGELADASEARQLLAEHVDIYLHGHQHQPASALSIDPDRRLLELAAGCVFESSRQDAHPNGLSVLTLALDERGRPQQAELRLRSWSPHGRFWHDDSSLYQNAKHGRLELAWPDINKPDSPPGLELPLALGHWEDAASDYQFCESLLQPAERAAWRGAAAESQLVELCSTVFARAEHRLARPNHALYHLTLGRAALYATLLHPQPSAVTGPELSLASAHTHLDAAVAGLRATGQPPELPQGLISRAWLSVIEGQPSNAHALLDEAWQLAERGPMPLDQADIQLHRARLFHDRSALARARALINTHEYGRHLATLDDTEQVLARADELHDRLRTALEFNEHRAIIVLVIAPLGLVADVEQVRERLGLSPSEIASWVIDVGPRAREQITALNRSRDALLAEKRLIWLRGSSSADARFVRRAAPDLTASIDVFDDLRSAG